MAVAPLFVSPMANLVAPLRLSGATNADSLAAINLAVQTVRAKFYQNLGRTRVEQLVSFNNADNPTTDDEILRSQANACEVVWVKLHLLKSLPTVFMDGSASVQQEWNEEGLVRQSQQQSVNRLIDQANDEVVSLLSILSGETTQETQVQGEAIGNPHSPNCAPGSDVFRPSLGEVVGIPSYNCWSV